jgi:hypothetical protein
MPPQGPFGAPPQGAFGGPAMMPTASGYEFNEYENIVIKELADNASFFGTVGIVFGILGTLGAVVSIASNANRPVSVVAVVGLLIQGIFARNAAQRFHNVVNTQGNDIPMMMEALTQLQRYYVVTATVGALSLLTSISAVINLLTMPST